MSTPTPSSAVNAAADEHAGVYWKDILLRNGLWQVYFPGKELQDDDVRMTIVVVLQSFFAERIDTWIDMDELRRHHRCTMNYTQLAQTIPVGEFAAVLKDEPEMVLACLGMAVHAAILSLRQRGATEIPALPYLDARTHPLRVRLDQYKPIMPLRHLKANFVDKFVSIRGNVVRVGNIKPTATLMTFVCSKCGAAVRQFCPDGKFTPPIVCPGLARSSYSSSHSYSTAGAARTGAQQRQQRQQRRQCKARSFVPERSSTITMDWQRVRVQEIVSSGQMDQGRIPRTVECELTQDLVDCCIPGDVITVTGIVKARQGDQKSRGTSRKSLYVLYIDVNSVSNGNENGSKLDVLRFSDRDLHAIVEIAHQQSLFRLLVHSLCPSIYGHEIVKAGLLLGLFGGVHKMLSERSKISVRGDPHVLIVGDPGLGKSQMLRAVSNAAPRGVYVCGNTTSTSGLTVTMVREGSGGDYALEAGALVLADQGVCCIDEFDKMSSEHNAMLEAMEQQTISIAKAGIVCSLSARASVIAAANPKGGHYDRTKTVAENLKISAPLL